MRQLHEILIVLGNEGLHVQCPIMCLFDFGSSSLLFPVLCPCVHSLFRWERDHTWHPSKSLGPS
jgi:hypothetical protein